MEKDEAVKLAVGLVEHLIDKGGRSGVELNPDHTNSPTKILELIKAIATGLIKTSTEL